WTGYNLARRLRSETQHAERGHAFSGSGFTDQAEHFAGQDAQVHAVHRFCDACFGIEIGPQSADVEERRHWSWENSLGSKASRTASPMNTTSSSVTKSAVRG